MTRDEFISHSIDRKMFGLEIGPGYAPAFPRSSGFNVETLDHATADDLREKYAALGVDIANIEEVTYVSDGRPIDQIIPRRGEYDFVFASHVIEHLTDPLGFLNSCELLLKPEGKLVLIIPDKRRCFDVFQSLTTTGDFLQAYQDQRSRHYPGRAFDFIADCAFLRGSGIWESHWTGEFSLANSLEQAAQVFSDASTENAPYIDIHAWRFTPSSLRLILFDLNALGYTSFREASFFPANNFEFYFSVSVSGAGCGLSRMDLHRDIIREQLESGMQVLAIHDAAE